MKFLDTQKIAEDPKGGDDPQFTNTDRQNFRIIDVYIIYICSECSN